MLRRGSSVRRVTRAELPAAGSAGALVLRAVAWDRWAHAGGEGESAAFDAAMAVMCLFVCLLDRALRQQVDFRGLAALEVMHMWSGALLPPSAYRRPQRRAGCCPCRSALRAVTTGMGPTQLG